MAGKNDHIIIRDEKVVAKICNSAGESETVCGFLDRVVESVMRKFGRSKPLKFKANLRNE